MVQGKENDVFMSVFVTKLTTVPPPKKATLKQVK